MRKSLFVLVLLCALVTIPALGAGKAGYDKGMKFESEDGKHTVNSGARVQVRFTHEDPEDGDSKGSFDIRRAKWWLKGTIYEHWKYKMQVVFSADETKSTEVTQGPPVEVEVDHPAFAELEDAYFQYTKNKMAQPWMGQGKVPFGRQQLTSSGKQQFVDRGITDKAFVPGRSQGVQLIGQTKNKKFEYAVGIFDDFKGQNIRSNTDDNFLKVARAVYTPFGEFKLDEVAHDYPDGPKLAIGVKALADTVGGGAGVETDNDTVGIEAAFRQGGLSAVAEWFSQSLDMTGTPEMETDGGYIQVGYLFPNKKVEIAGRHALVSPDVAGASEDVTETGAAINYYFNKHNYKIQADVRDIQYDGDPSKDTQETRVQAQFIF
jgi:phosphate-selective porin OprO/OprP